MTTTYTPPKGKLNTALETFVERSLHEFISEGEAKQILFCLTEPKASQRGKRWAVSRVRDLVRDADIVDSGGARADGRKSRPSTYAAKKAAKAAASRAQREKMRGAKLSPPQRGRRS